ncbi:MAG TPA: wax ester/triacylglycerol synthase domain-containing protein, partial [Acidimicrobiales bacterium]|nr:wax ester/triacylglycerol synthase domain-containing protein [Acidimicrobiales bacterium]
MRETDALSWRIERDPVLRSNVVAVAWLDRSPDWGRLRDRVEKASSALPSFRQRVVELPGPLPAPRWVADDEFDLDWHLRRIDAPDPHGPEAVLDVARRAAMSSFDPARPLWEFTLVDRVVGGRAALVLKIHHSLTDGVGGIQLALHLFELDPGTGRQSARVVEPVVEPAARAGSPAPAGTTAHEEVSPLRETLSDGLRVGTAVARRAGSALPALVGAVRRPAGTLADL